MAELKEKVKIALRITHSYLDSDIEDTIKAARLDMKRAGIRSELIDSDDELIQGIIKTYCLYVYAPDEKLAQGYFESYQYQLDNARKSKTYGGVASV